MEPDKPTYDDLVDALEDVLWQACGDADKDEYNSMALRSYAHGIRTLVKAGKATIVHEASNRYIFAKPNRSAPKQNGRA